MKNKEVFKKYFTDSKKYDNLSLVALG